jgi:hypothetical protein
LIVNNSSIQHWTGTYHRPISPRKTQDAGKIML